MEKRTQLYLHPNETWDRHFGELRDIKKMLKWIIVFMRHNQPNFASQVDEHLIDIGDILEKIIVVKSGQEE